MRIQPDRSQLVAATTKQQRMNTEHSSSSMSTSTTASRGSTPRRHDCQPEAKRCDTHALPTTAETPETVYGVLHHT
jgi:hypothetical protein